MNDDVDIKQMFEAQRKLDEQRVPDFDETYAKALASDKRLASSENLGSFRSLAVVAAALVVAASLVVGLVIWSSFGGVVDEATNPAPRSDKPQIVDQPRGRVVEVAATSDFQTLSRACDALQATIRSVDGTNSTTRSTTAVPDGDRGMEWPTETDSLISYR